MQPPFSPPLPPARASQTLTVLSAEPERSEWVDDIEAESESTHELWPVSVATPDFWPCWSAEADGAERTSCRTIDLSSDPE